MKHLQVKVVSAVMKVDTGCFGSSGQGCWKQAFREDLQGRTVWVWLEGRFARMLRKHPDAGENWGQEEKGTTEDEMAGWRHNDSMGMSLSKLWELVIDREDWHVGDHGVTKSWTHWVTGLDWSELTESYERRAKLEVSCFLISNYTTKSTHHNSVLLA